MSEDRADLCVVGAGIVGLATAWAATKRRPGARVVVLEKEDSVAYHQTGRNSGVIHSGIYYKPGSLKAETCRAGRAALIDFCREHGVSYELCGKVVVALDESELPALETIRERVVSRLGVLDPAALEVETSWLPTNAPGNSVQISLVYQFEPISPIMPIGLRTLAASSTMIIPAAPPPAWIAVEP